jgi:ribonuclease BN (tRNA processing enzyme)
MARRGRYPWPGPMEPAQGELSAGGDDAVASGLSVVVAGCDGSWTGAGGAGSGYLVTCGATRVLVDAGPGCFANLQEWLDPALIDAVVLSHHHPDHWLDIHALATHARLVVGRIGLPVYAPVAVIERSFLSDSTTLAWHEVSDGAVAHVRDLALSFHRTDHSFETLAIRIDGGGRSLGYSADTGPGWSLDELGVGLDLLLSEATYTVEHEGTADHMSGRQAGEQARRAEARRLVITHRWPTIDAALLVEEAEEAFGAPVEQAAIGKEFTL